MGKKADQIRQFLTDYPNSTRRDFMEAANTTVASSYFSLIRKRMAGEGELREKGSQAEAIRLFLAKRPEGTRAEFITETGMAVSSSHFSVLRTTHLAKLGRRGDTRKQPKDTSEALVAHQANTDQEETVKILETALGQAQRDNEYLKWLLVGEREGFLDRALEEMDNQED